MFKLCCITYVSTINSYFVFVYVHTASQCACMHSDQSYEFYFCLYIRIQIWYVCLYTFLVNPTQIFCKYYLYLMEKLQPVQVCKMLYYKKLLSQYDLDVIVNMPIDHMKSLYIIEYFRHMGATGIFEFVDILLEIGNQKQISKILRNGELNVYTYSVYVYVLCVVHNLAFIIIRHTHERKVALHTSAV